MPAITELHYVAYNHFEKDWKIQERSIEDYELLLISAGQGHLFAEGEKLLFQEGDMLLIPPGLRHSFCSARLPLTICCLHFDLYEQQESRFSAPIYENTEGNLVRGFFFQENSHSDGLFFRRKHLEAPLQTSLEKGSMLAMQAEQLTAFIKRGKKEELPELSRCLVSLFQQMSPSGRGPSSPAEKILRHVEQNYRRTITLSELSDFLHLQPTYISQLFRKQVGVSLSEYIRLYRLAVAKSLLSYTGESIDEIAAQTGFYDCAHFCRCFHAAEGMSPSQYRKRKA